MLAAPLPAWCAQDAKVWLDKVADAVQSLNYEGTFIFIRGDKVDTMRIVHGRNEHGVRERLVTLTGEAREVVRDRGVLTCVWPRKNSVMVEGTRASHGIPSTIPSRTRGLEDHYRLRVDGKNRIAGTACRNIAVEPRDNLRYGHRLCVAEDSGMLLESMMLNARGEPIEKVMFTSLKLRERIPDEQFEPTMIEDDHVWQRAGPRQQPFELEPDPGWRIERKPPGFEVTAVTKRVMAASPQPVQHMILTDGLASVSVFIARPVDRAALFEGTTRSGALNAYARSLSGHQITVVGEVPEQTVKMIGLSMTYNQAD
ncbi:MAG: MucB/RseB C-terminal domain-containing protein [Gammaproteobacteria bacterium]